MKLSNITERITNRAFPWFCAALFAVVHSACNNEQINEGRLPEDTYPLRFSVTLSGNELSRAGKTALADDDIIGVSFFGEESKYKADGSVADGASTLYWESSGSSTIKAWFPTGSDENKKVDLSDQTEGYDAFDFLYAEKNVTFVSDETTEKLVFYHQMAKVNCTLENDESLGDNVYVKFYGASEISYEKGVVTSLKEGMINPYFDATGGEAKYSALLLPAQMKGKDFILMAGDNGEAVYTSLNDELTNLKAGHEYNYKIKVLNGVIELELTDKSVSWTDNEEINTSATEKKN